MQFDRAIDISSQARTVLELFRQLYIGEIVTNLELSNALAHDAKLVLSFITEKEFRDLRDSLRSLALIAISYTLAKQEDDQATDSANTFAT